MLTGQSGEGTKELWLRQRWWTQKPWTRAGYSTVERGRKEQTEKAFQKRQHREKSRETGVSMLVCTSSGRHTGGKTLMLGKWVLPRPNYAHEEKMLQKARYCFKHTGFEIQFKIKMRNSAGLLWSPHVPHEVTSLSRSTLCKYTCSLFKRCEGQAAPAPAALVITCTALSTLPALTHPIRTAPL